MNNSPSNQFTELIVAISDLAPPVTVPWLSYRQSRVPMGSRPAADLGGKVAAMAGDGSSPVGSRPAVDLGGKGGKVPALAGEGSEMKQLQNPADKIIQKGAKEGVAYCPLQIKRTKTFPNSKRRRKKKVKNS